MECEDKQTEFRTVLKQVFDDGHNCARCLWRETTAKGKLVEVEEKLQPKQGTLSADHCTVLMLKTEHLKMNLIISFLLSPFQNPSQASSLLLVEI